MQDRWRKEVNRIRASHGMPGLADFSEFIKNEARIANDPIFSRGSLNQVSGQEKLKYKPKPRRDESFPKYMAGATITQDFIPKEQVDDKCVLSKGSHHLDHCPDFLRKSLENRKAWVKDKGLCFACYDPGHRANGCSQTRKCERCPGKHPTALHDDNFIPKITRKATSQDHKGDVPVSKSARVTTSVGEPSCYAVNEGGSFSTMPIVPVKLKANRKELLTYAMLDNCSTGTVVREDLSKELEVVGAETNLVIKTINGTEFHNTTVFMDLVVSDMDGDNSIKLPRTYTRKEIPASKEEIPRPEWIRNWSHLHRIVDDVPVFLSDVEIGLLIGSNCPKAIEPKDFIVGDHGGRLQLRPLRDGL